MYEWTNWRLIKIIPNYIDSSQGRAVNIGMLFKESFKIRICLLSFFSHNKHFKLFEGGLCSNQNEKEKSKFADKSRHLAEMKKYSPISEQFYIVWLSIKVKYYYIKWIKISLKYY